MLLCSVRICRSFIFLLMFLFTKGAAAVPVPTAAQLEFMNTGISQFMHFGLEPFSFPHVNHNCVSKGQSCIPAKTFNPSNLSTDQWVETAVAFGAKEICLTAHHEGGFSLWPTKHNKDYSVDSTPYGKDVLADFVKSCKKHNVKICYYMGPNSNGWLNNQEGLSSDEFVELQLRKYEEILDNYGPISRFWWDHYRGRCEGKYNACPGGFPDAWDKFISMIREKSPSTLICPGPDCSGHSDESGAGDYPVWYTCEEHSTKPGKFVHSKEGSLFHPRETCVTPIPGWFPKGDGEGQTKFTLEDFWDAYSKSVAIGYVNTINAPPGTTGQIPSDLANLMVNFGELIKPISKPLVSKSDHEGACAGFTVELNTAGLSFNTLVMRENLTRGQRIASYTIEYESRGGWKAFSECSAPEYRGCIHGKSVAAMLVDSLPYQSERSRVRFRCLESFEDPVSLSLFGATLLDAPAGALATSSDSLLTLRRENLHREDKGSVDNPGAIESPRAPHARAPAEGRKLHRRFLRAKSERQLSNRQSLRLK